jgi:hypothetical protein
MHGGLQTQLLREGTHSEVEGGGGHVREIGLKIIWRKNRWRGTENIKT